ncbi:hypothetical protein [Rhizobium phage RHph_X3_9]|nr:hypothetical protein [Rhizobium phage RHph_X3_9]
MSIQYGAEVFAVSKAVVAKAPTFVTIDPTFSAIIKDMASVLFAKYPAFWGSSKQRELQEYLAPVFGTDCAGDVAALMLSYKGTGSKSDHMAHYFTAHKEIVTHHGTYGKDVARWSAILYVLLVCLPHYERKYCSSPLNIREFVEDFLEYGEFQTGKEY